MLSDHVTIEKRLETVTGQVRRHYGARDCDGPSEELRRRVTGQVRRRVTVTGPRNPGPSGPPHFFAAVSCFF